MGRFVALLRGINVGGHRKVPMAALRDVAGQLGFEHVETYVASGNLVFSSDAAASKLEKMLERTLAGHFGFDVDVILRSAVQWAAYCKANPLPAESDAHPSKVMMTIGKDKPTRGDCDALAARASDGEKVRLAGDALWIYFPNGAGRSKLATATGKHVWTTRNWRTIVTLRNMLGQ